MQARPPWLLSDPDLSPSSGGGGSTAWPQRKRPGAVSPAHRPNSKSTINSASKLTATDGDGEARCRALAAVALFGDADDR